VAIAQQKHDGALHLNDAVTQKQLEGAVPGSRHESLTSQQSQDVGDFVPNCASQQQLSKAIESCQEVAESLRNSVSHVDVEQFSNLMCSVQEDKIIENDAHRKVIARVNELCEQLATVETTITAVERSSSELELMQRFESFVDQIEHRFDDFSKHRMLRVENDVSLLQTRLDDVVAKPGTDHLASVAQTLHANVEAERSAHQRVLVRINDLCEQMASLDDAIILDSGTKHGGVDPEPSSAWGHIQLPLNKEESMNDLEEQW